MGKCNIWYTTRFSARPYSLCNIYKWSSSLYELVSSFLLLLIFMCLHFSGWNLRSLLSLHSSSLVRSSCNVSFSSSPLLTLNILVSSANKYESDSTVSHMWESHKSYFHICSNEEDFQVFRYKVIFGDIQNSSQNSFILSQLCLGTIQDEIHRKAKIHVW
jgi:hypothetical protein